MGERITIEDLAERLGVLRRRDTARTIFGARAHKYESTPASPVDIAALEEKVGAVLPEEYRLWLLRIGWGAGPNYGLFSPEAVVSELPYDRTGFGGDVADAASITMADVGTYFEGVRKAGSPWNARRITANAFRGAIPVSHQGCNGYTHLAVAGDMRGTVFGECCDVIGEPWTAAAAFWPEDVELLVNLEDRAPRPFTFLQWIDNWLEKSLAAIKGRNV